LIGEIVGEYKIVSQLVPGGTGDVYVGEHKDLGTKAAIEILHAPVAGNAEAAQKYLETVRAVGQIKHGGTMKIVDAGIDAAGRVYVIMELLEGDTLAKRIETSGRLSGTQIGEIGRQLANVLAATHDEGIVHGDLRPDAVFLMRQGGLARGEPVKVTEFGVADLKRAVGIAIGPVYTAPELLGSGETVDWRVDAYGLGCVAFEMATGKPPFIGASADEVRSKHLEQVPPAARSMMPDVAPALDQLIGRLLSKRPDDRFASMREIARAFEPFGGGASRPLAQTANDQPVVVLGEVQAAGELKAREPAKEPPPEPRASIQVIGPEATAAVTTEPEPKPEPAPTPKPKPKQPSKFPIAIVVVILLVAGGATAIAFAMQ
jgi:serine/threonine-protein kinase